MRAKRDVLHTQRGHAKCLMLLGIFGVPDPETSDVEKAHAQRHHPLASEPSFGQIIRHGLSQRRQGTAKFDDVREFFLVPFLSPYVVVSILSPSCRVDPDCLDVSVRPGTDPYVLPGGWNRQSGDPVQSFPV